MLIITGLAFSGKETAKFGIAPGKAAQRVQGDRSSSSLECPERMEACFSSLLCKLAWSLTHSDGLEV